MTTSISAPNQLNPDSLEFAAFEKIRRTKPGYADGTTFFHGGIEYGLAVDTPCRLELTHAVIECISGPMAGRQLAMASLCWIRQDRHDVNGLGLVMQALATGVVINEVSRPQNQTWRVLPTLPVPSCYVKSEISTNESEKNDSGKDGQLAY